MPLTVLHTPIWNFASGALVHKDRVDPEQLCQLWAVFSKRKALLSHGRRLENLSWRLWYREVLSEIVRLRGPRGPAVSEPCNACMLPASSTLSSLPRLDEKCSPASKPLKGPSVLPPSAEKNLLGSCIESVGSTQRSGTSSLHSWEAFATAKSLTPADLENLFNAVAQPATDYFDRPVPPQPALVVPLKRCASLPDLNATSPGLSPFLTEVSLTSKGEGGGGGGMQQPPLPRKGFSLKTLPPLPKKRLTRSSCSFATKSVGKNKEPLATTTRPVCFIPSDPDQKPSARRCPESAFTYMIRNTRRASPTPAGHSTFEMPLQDAEKLRNPLFLEAVQCVADPAIVSSIPEPLIGSVIRENLQSPCPVVSRPRSASTAARSTLTRQQKSNCLHELSSSMEHTQSNQTAYSSLDYIDTW